VDRLLVLCRKYEVETNAILEIGAGFGTFCAEVKKRTTNYRARSFHRPTLFHGE
jgi:hypothetical protein